MKAFVNKSLATGLLLILCCGFFGCSDPDKRLEGQWELYGYKDGLQTSSTSSLLTVRAEDTFELDFPGGLPGIIDVRYTATGSYKTERDASPALITFRYNVLGMGVINTGIYRFEGPFWNRTLYLALDYEIGDDSKLALSKSGGPVLVGKKRSGSKAGSAMEPILKLLRCPFLLN